MARLPQLIALLLKGGCGKARAAKISCNLAKTFRVLGHACLAAMKFQQQKRRFWQGQFGITINRLNHQLVEQFNARHGQSILHSRNDTFAGSLDRRERTSRRRNGRRDTAQTQG